MTNSQPVTQGDLNQLRHELQTWKQELVDRQSDLLEKVHERLTQVRAEMLSHREEITRHFDVVFENYARDMRGAAQDEFVMLKDRQHDHTQRIERLESHCQLVA